jgi:hypothetical protein
MLWRLAADLVVIGHLIWILFLIGGAMIGRRIRWIRWLHIAALTFSLLLQVFRWICPLTHLEVWLRRQADPSSGYPGDFLAHYAERVVYWSVPPWAVLLATVLIAGLSLWAYWPRSSRQLGAG